MIYDFDTFKKNNFLSVFRAFVFEDKTYVGWVGFYGLFFTHETFKYRADAIGQWKVKKWKALKNTIEIIYLMITKFY